MIMGYGTKSYLQNERHILNGNQAIVQMLDYSRVLRIGIQRRGLVLRRLTNAHYSPFYVDMVPEDFVQWRHQSWHRDKHNRIMFDYE